jgi:hypothetical protein
MDEIDRLIALRDDMAHDLQDAFLERVLDVLAVLRAEIEAIEAIARLQ